MLKLYNSLTHKIEDFTPINPDEVGFYICGPTVYHDAHIGNLRTMIMGDLVRRTLQYSGYKVRQVMNITDVGHLTSDADTGEDKMEKNVSNKQEYLAVAEKYTRNFLENLLALNIQTPELLPKASDHVAEQIKLIETLIEKGFAYESDEAVYFDVAKYPHYNQLTEQNLEEMKLGARQEVVRDPKKKNPIDFVLWFKIVGRYQSHILHWPSPWGEGFPGWHIECSAMSIKYLGETFDIHAGGVDLKFPHHTNEIAQAEAATGKKLSNYWLHGEHLLINSGKMAKSEGTGLILQDLIDKGFNPLAYRYLVLTSHYRSRLNFTDESMTAAQNALNNLYQEISTYEEPKGNCPQFEQNFEEAMDDDLNTPKAIAIMWDLINTDEFPTAAKTETLFKFDQVLGLKLKEVWEAAKVLPDTVKELVSQREAARKAKDFSRSDELRKAIESNGYILEDTPDGYRLKKKF
ncbi:MAG: cysteine--tRNA ligase [Candidatus Doudnabacteria bacterium]|nr:cysteine--tRNA ligase [Candidatus Doudnabacteria bacterium]